MWFGKNKTIKETKEAGKKEFSEEVNELHVQIRKDDTVHGQDSYTWPNGDTYVGEWRDGKRHGQGTWTLADGTKCEGEWKNDEMV